MSTSKPTLNSTSGPLVPAELVLVLGILAVSTASIFIRKAQGEASSLVIAAVRMSLASLVLLPIYWVRQRGELKRLGWGQIGMLVLSGVLLALHFITWISSLEYTSVASSVVLVTTSPLWVALLSPLFLKEKLTHFVWYGLGIAMLGSIVVGLSQGCLMSPIGLTCPGLYDFFKGRAFFGNLLALAGAWFSAGYLLIGRRVRPNLSIISYTLAVYGTASLVLLGLVAITGQKLSGYSSTTYGYLVGLALVPQLIGHSSFNWALKYLPAAFVSVALLGEPIGTVILAYLFLREAPTLFEMMGGVFILVGIYVASRRRNQQG